MDSCICSRYRNNSSWPFPLIFFPLQALETFVQYRCKCLFVVRSGCLLKLSFYPESFLFTTNNLSLLPPPPKKKDWQAPTTTSLKCRWLSLHLQHRPRGRRGLYTSQTTQVIALLDIVIYSTSFEKFQRVYSKEIHGKWDKLHDYNN